MPISLVRIDDRLVHGQVVEAWLPHLRADTVLVAADAAAKDDTQQALMRLALPDNVDLEVLPPKESAEYLTSERSAKAKVLVLVPSPKEALELLDAGIPIPLLNVGGLHYSAGRIQLGRVIFLSEEDLRTLRELARRGVVLEGRAVPSDRKTDVAGLLGAAA